MVSSGVKNIPAGKHNFEVDNIVTSKSHHAAVEIVTAANHVATHTNCGSSAARGRYIVRLQRRIYILPPRTRPDASDLGIGGVFDLIDESCDVRQYIILDNCGLQNQ